MTSVFTDLSLLQPGGRHGGIKPALYRLLRILNCRRNVLIRVIAQKGIHEELSTESDIDDENILSTDQFAQLPLAKDTVLFSPLPSLELYRPERKTIFMCPDLLHKDYPDSLSPEDINYRHHLFSEAAKKVDQFVTVSKFSKSRLMDLYDIQGDRIHVIPHASLTKEKPNQPSMKERYFIYPANGWKHKNHQTLLTGYHSYRQNVSSPWKLLLTGHFSNEVSSLLRENLKALRIQESVRLCGYLDPDTFLETFANAACLLFPSMYEGFGLPLLEAMQLEIPIIASNQLAIKETAGDAALFVDARSPIKLSEAMVKIHNDEHLRKQLVEKGKVQVNAFSWTTAAAEFENLVGKISYSIPNSI